MKIKEALQTVEIVLINTNTWDLSPQFNSDKEVEALEKIVSYLPMYQEALEKVKNLLTDKTVGKIKCENDDESFGALLILSYLRRCVESIEKELV